MQSALERRQEILKLLNVRRHETLINLAFHFHVTARTIQRDIALLSESYPIYTAQGNNGGVFLCEGYLIGNNYLTANEEIHIKKIIEKAEEEDKKILTQILKKFSLPKK